MINKLAATTLAILTLFSCSEDQDVNKQEEIVGQWIIKEVIYDGSLQPVWNGVHLTFEQDETNSGAYSMPDTPHDSVWNVAGKWSRTARASELILNDSVQANFQVGDEELIIAMSLPWTAQSTCKDGQCILIVSGDWMFKFQRER